MTTDANFGGTLPTGSIKAMITSRLNYFLFTCTTEWERPAQDTAMRKNRLSLLRTLYQLIQSRILEVRGQRVLKKCMV